MEQARFKFKDFLNLEIDTSALYLIAPPSGDQLIAAMSSDVTSRRAGAGHTARCAFSSATPRIFSPQRGHACCFTGPRHVLRFAA
jgi:hypothetical protein